MYVCLCHAVTDRQIEQAVENGHCSLRQVRQCLNNMGQTCGQCLPMAREIIDDKLIALAEDIAQVA